MGTTTRRVDTTAMMVLSLRLEVDGPCESVLPSVSIIEGTMPVGAEDETSETQRRDGTRLRGWAGARAYPRRESPEPT